MFLSVTASSGCSLKRYQSIHVDADQYIRDQLPLLYSVDKS